MLEFGSKDNDNSFYYWASFSFRVALCMTFTFGIILCFKRLLQKRNQEYVDIARIIQYCLLLLHFTIGLGIIITGLILRSGMPYGLKYFFIYDIHFFCFVLMNQIYWVILLNHLKNFREVNQEDFEIYEYKKKNLGFEVSWGIAVTSFYSFILAILIFVIFGEVFGCEEIQDTSKSTKNTPLCIASRFIQYGLSYSRPGVYLLLIITELFLYRALHKKLNSSLFKHYKPVQTKLFRFFVSSVAFKIFVVIHSSLGAILGSNFHGIDYFEDKFQNTLLFILVFAISILKVIWYFIYIFYTANNIDFPEYLISILKGRNLENRFSDVSIFVRASGTVVENEDHHESSLLSSGDTEAHEDLFRSKSNREREIVQYKSYANINEKDDSVITTRDSF
ncbi:unnamed protein product [Moneuplotes crassus]|uniref:Uncharacterized protein n=1 Tax=Euplotes crassus TaxID=5936 RepID=A0AAD1ULP0_EUPCR|nr:unnamed protein product [Moneuplotes crassus]